uniref:Probable U2 small nuclear ribonucleoprotein A' n=1 Tax=Ditylenchus dipsaci TaxID=166011 RepID=A0A915CLL1_9BILA
MAFGWPTSYWQLSASKLNGGVSAYDKAIEQASEEYKSHMHNIFCDNCHSHVALALNSMKYDGRSDWNMVNLCAYMLFKGHTIGVGAALKQYLPYCIWIIAITAIGYLKASMVRISVDVINDSYQFINTVRQREISLRNLQIPTIENLGVTKDQFDVIDLSDNNIRKLDNLPRLNRLETLLLHNNHIQQIDKKIGEQIPHLKTLVLTNNNIAELGDIDSLASCQKLEYLSLIGNPLTHKQHYRQYVIFKLKTVRVLDFRRIKDEERKVAKKLFKGSSGAKLREEVVKLSKAMPTDEDRTAQIKTRSAEEQAKIKAMIKNARTLTEVENLQSMLQSGHINTNNNGNGGGLEAEEDSGGEENGQQMET